MFYSNDRNNMRNIYRQCWHKFQQQAPMEPMEQMIAGVVAMHPEYHALLQQSDAVLDQEFHAELGQSNPFLHMGMHIALQEQVRADHPAGISAIHQTLAAHHDLHETEHRMMECLGEMLWKAQNRQCATDDEEYLECLRKLA